MGFETEESADQLPHRDDADEGENDDKHNLIAKRKPFARLKQPGDVDGQREQTDQRHQKIDENVHEFGFHLTSRSFSVRRSD